VSFEVEGRYSHARQSVPWLAKLTSVRLNGVLPV
jgi:hypothetical protein